DPNNPVPHIVLAEVAGAFGQYEVAISSAVDAMALYPLPDYDKFAVDPALAWGDPRRARDDLRRALPHRDSAAIRIALARLSLKLGDRATARVDVGRALELDPLNLEAKDILSQLGN